MKRIAVVWAALLVGVVRTAGAQAPADARILVMPFENAGRDGRVLWLGEASAVLVADGLTARGLNAIVRQERQRAFERLQVPPSSVLTEATVIRIGQLLGAAQVVVGTFQVEGETLAVHARSIALEAGRVQADATASGPLADLFAIYERVLSSLTPASSVAAATYPPVSAFEAYIKGLLATKTETAVNFFNAALKLYSAYDRVRFALWDVYTAAGEHARAREALRGVASESEWARRAVFFAALSDVSLKRYDEAFTDLRTLADKQPTATVMNNLGAVLLKRGSTTQQTGVPTYYFNRAVELDPDDPDYSFNLGYAYWEARDPQAAAYWLRETVRRNPSDGDAHFVLGTALLASGTAAEGGRELELARRLSARYEAAQKRAGGDEVPKGLERLKDEPDPRPARLIDASLASSAQRDQQELARFYYDHASRLYQEGNDDRDALAEAGRALYLSPYMSDAHILIGRIHLRNGRVREAIDAFKLALWSAETAAAHAALAEAFRQANDSAGARTEAERALALDPSSAEARRVLGMVQSR